MGQFFVGSKSSIFGLAPAVKLRQSAKPFPPCHSERSEESRREMLLSFLRPREILHYATIRIQGVATVFSLAKTAYSYAAWQRKGG